MKRSDPEYYAARLRAEQEAATAATCEQARMTHLELALRYERLLDASAQPKRTADDDGSESAGNDDAARAAS